MPKTMNRLAAVKAQTLKKPGLHLTAGARRRSSLLCSIMQRCH